MAAKETKVFKPKESEISFDAKSAKVYIGQKIYLTLEKFFRDDFDKFFKKELSPTQKITVIQLFFNTYFPKEIKMENVDPFEDWTTEELANYYEKGEKPAGKIIYTVK
jgi:hypothetical protein